MDIEELRKAAERMRRWDAGERPSTIYTQGSDVIGAADNDAWDLARRLVAELSRRDAEQAERAKPIDEEWLRVVMPDRRRSDERIWHSLHIKNDLYETHLLVRHVELSRFWAVLVQALEHDETLTEKVAFGDLKNRGQLLDLLAALKGGES